MTTSVYILINQMENNRLKKYFIFIRFKILLIQFTWTIKKKTTKKHTKKYEIFCESDIFMMILI